MSAQKPFRFQFFLPDARMMSEGEIKSLPPEKTRSGAAAGREGLWLEITCPNRSCLDAEGNLTLPVASSSSKKGVFLNLFCPEDACAIVQSTDLP